MSEPYVRRKSGELLSSADWNAMQRMVREDIAAVEAKILALEAGLPEAEEGVSAARAKTGGIVTVRSGVGYLGSEQGPQKGAWVTHSNTTMSLTLAGDSLVRLRLHLKMDSGYTHYQKRCFQFQIGSGSSWAPVRTLSESPGFVFDPSISLLGGVLLRSTHEECISLSKGSRQIRLGSYGLGDASPEAFNAYARLTAVVIPV